MFRLISNYSVERMRRTHVLRHARMEDGDVELGIK